MRKTSVVIAGVVLAGLSSCGALTFLIGGAGAGGDPPSGGSGVLNAAAVPEAYRAALIAADDRCEGISAPVLAAQIEAESAWNAAAVSFAGAAGPAQFMPGTWASWGQDYSGDGIADVHDPADAVGSQASFMCSLYDQVGRALEAGTVRGDRLQLTLAAYNAGFGNVTKYAGVPPFPETQRYVERILAAIPRYTSLVPGAVDAGGGPAVSADGTFRVPTSGSGRLDPSNLCQIPWAKTGLVLRCDAAQSLAELNTAYATQFGGDLGISSAYRDYASQVATKATKGGLAAAPGTSNHGWGLAVDLASMSAGSRQYVWLRANAPGYGWDHPTWARAGGSKPEAWHWEFVGTR